MFDDVGQLPLVTETFEAVETLLQLEDKLRVLDSLVNMTIDWTANEQRVFLWHLWELSRSKKLRMYRQSSRYAYR